MREVIDMDGPGGGITDPRKRVDGPDMRTLLGKGSGAATTTPEGGVDMQRFRHGAATASKSSGLVGLVKSAIEKITGRKK